jgi:uncharacterized protein
MKIVLDTNVFVSGLLAPAGAPGQIVGAWLEARFDLAMSPEQLAEVGRVLAYPRIQKVLRWDEKRIEEFLRQLYVRAEMIDISTIVVHLPSDRDDEPILATLIAARADFLVTGDRELLKARERYAIETPAEFIRRL